jgi:hypothetical protein
MKNILTKIFSPKNELSSKEISFLEITKTTKVSELFNVISNITIKVKLDTWVVV